MSVHGATGPDRLRASLRASAARGTAWLARAAAPLATVGAPLPPALLGGELAEIAGERLRGILRGDAPVPASPASSPRTPTAPAADAASNGRAMRAAAAPDPARDDASAPSPVVLVGAARADAPPALAPADDAPRRPVPPRPGSLAASVRDYWAARGGDDAAPARGNEPIARAGRDDARARDVGPRDVPTDDLPADGPTGDARSASAMPPRERPAPAVPAAASLPRATLRARAADVHAPAPLPTRAAPAGLAAAWDDTLADALADVLREQALRDGVTLAW